METGHVTDRAARPLSVGWALSRCTGTVALMGVIRGLGGTVGRDSADRRQRAALWTAPSSLTKDMKPGEKKLVAYRQKVNDH